MLSTAIDRAARREDQLASKWQSADATWRSSLAMAAVGPAAGAVPSIGQIDGADP